MVFEPRSKTFESSDRARFVRDGFAGWAVLFPFLWLFRHGLWVSGFSVLVLWTCFGALTEISGLSLAGAVLPVLMGLLVALEGPSLRAWRLRRKKFEDVGVVEAENEEEAAILYYAGAESNSVSRESLDDSRETSSAAPFIGRSQGPVRSLLDPPRMSA